MSAPRKPHPIESLPFVTDAAPKSRTNVKRCLWDVKPTGDYAEECRIGSRYALDYMRYESADRAGHGYLFHIVEAMFEALSHRERSGIEVAFLSLIGWASGEGLFAAQRRLARWAAFEVSLTHGALVNQRPDGSVVIEQPDGTRAVYRKEGAEGSDPPRNEPSR